MLLPVQSGRAGLHFGCVKVMNIAILTDADKEHYEKILSSQLSNHFMPQKHAF